MLVKTYYCDNCKKMLLSKNTNQIARILIIDKKGPAEKEYEHLCPNCLKAVETALENQFKEEESV